MSSQDSPSHADAGAGKPRRINSDAVMVEGCPGRRAINVAHSDVSGDEQHNLGPLD
jgi:hypothetical protein